MTDIAERYRTVAQAFTDVARAVATDSWARPSPCEGWVARDVVRHLVEWVPPFLRNGAGIDVPALPSPDDDPVSAWETLSHAIQSLLDDQAVSKRTFHNEHTGTHPLDEAIALFILGDVLIHTWDLARSVDRDVTLDGDEVQRMLLGIEPLGDTLVESGHYAARVAVPDDADAQTKLLAFTGRRAL